MPPILPGSLLLTVLLLLSASLGRRLFAILRIRIDPAPERALLATGFGLGMLQFLPFALLACGIGHPVDIKFGVAALALLLVPDILAVLRKATNIPKQALLVFQSAPAWQRLLTVLFALLLFAVYLRALCPITDDDGLSYHLPAALRWLQAGRFVFLPTLTYTNWPSGTESLFVLLLGLHHDAPVGIVQFTFGSLTVAGIWLSGRRIGGTSLAWTGVTLLLVYKVFWEEMTQAHVDLGATVFATLSVLALHVATRNSHSAAVDVTNPQSAIRNPQLKSPQLLVALFAGLGATCKLNGVWIVVAMALTAAFAHQQPFKERFRGSAVFILSAVVVVLPWLARSWFLTGNPIYPLFYKLFGGREWTADGWARVQHYFFLMNTPPGQPPTPANLLLMRAFLVLVASAIALLVYFRTRRSEVQLPARFGFTFMPLLFLSSGYNMRFLLPAFPCVIFCAAYGLHGLLFKTNSRSMAGAIGIPLLAAVLIFRTAGKGLDPKLPMAMSVTLGTTTSEEYLRKTLPDYAVVEQSNATLAPTDRVLVGTWEESTAYYRNQALRPNYWLQDSVHYDSQMQLDEDLARLGVTHLVFKPMEPEWCVKSSVCNGRLTHETSALETLIQRRGERLYESNGITLYKLR